MPKEEFIKRNLTVVRIFNNEINENFSGVYDYIDMIVKGNLCPDYPPLGGAESAEGKR